MSLLKIMKESRSGINFPSDIRKGQFKKTQRIVPIEQRTLAGEVKRGYIPHAVKFTDKPKDIAAAYGVSYGTACVWVRILNGPKWS